MLKFFRQYNKIILAVGCVVLMVAFLVPQAVSMFSPKPQDRVLGTMHGQDVTAGQLQDAAGQLDLLENLFQRTGGAIGLGPLDLAGGYDRETWLMVLHDAQEMGLSASPAEVAGVLSVLGIDDTTLDKIARQRKVPQAYIRQIIRNWLVSERYRLLAQGRAPAPGLLLSGSPSITMLSELGKFTAAVLNEQDPQRRQLLLMQAMQSPQFIEMIRGNGRISESAAAFFIHENLERVGGQLLTVTPEVTDDLRAQVTDAQLKRLFEEYEDFMPGEGSPYPFGYRYPARIKLEYLEVPMDAVRSAVTVGNIDVLAYYRDHRDRFADSKTGESPEVPSDEVRADIAAGLTAQRAQALMQRILADARAAFAENTRGLASDAKGYKVLPADFQPIPLEEVADRIAAKHGVQPVVVDLTDQWKSMDELFGIPGLGLSIVEGTRVPLAAYLESVKELAAGDNAGPTQLQVGLAGATGIGADGSRYLPRVGAADPAHAPASLEEVRDQVTTDAATVAAYEQLIRRADTFKQRAAAEGLSALAEAVGGQVEPFGPLPQREPGTGGGGQVAPVLPGVGRDAGLIDAAFAVIAHLAPDADADALEALPAEQRVVARPVDRKLLLAVLEVTSRTVPTRADFEQLLAQGAGLAVDAELLGDLTADQPLSKEALAERVGFDLVKYEGPDEDAEAPAEGDAKDAATGDGAAGDDASS